MSGFGFPKTTQNFEQSNFFDVTKTVGISGAATLIYQLTIPQGELYLLSMIHVSCRMTGCLVVSLDGVSILTARNSPAQPDITHYLSPQRRLQPGEVLSATFEIRSQLSDAEVDFHVSGPKKIN